MISHYNISGSIYHDNKDEFKSILKKFNLKWSGSMYKGKWSSDSTSVTPVWNKEDGERVSGHMIVESNDEKVYHNICLAVENILKGELDVAGVFQASHDNESDFYAQITKPDVDYLRKTGCPESWIPLIMEDWRKKVEAHRNGEK